jgi:hypothetical protein
MSKAVVISNTAYRQQEAILISRQPNAGSEIDLAIWWTNQ